jgi:hypothetical protein
VSIGPSHWTLALSPVGDDPPLVREGELCGFLAYLADFKTPAFVEAFERFGWRIGEQWIDATGDRTGQALFDSGQRKYTSFLAQQDDNGDYVPRGLTHDEANYFRNWHWHYRWVMAGRTIDGFRKGMWDMVRIRLRDILSTPFPAEAGISDVPDGSGGTRTATIGDRFTSEKAVGMLLRWHIFRPFEICAGGEAGPRVLGAVATAGDPSTWLGPGEADLITALYDEIVNIDLANDTTEANVEEDLELTLGMVRGWPTYDDRNLRGYALGPEIGPLSEAINSFKNNFDDSNLPAAPV